tara:strand:- start:9486 stop:10580 length:1095 start_codon:yes stop_codon:yes gene_type:complete
MSVKLLSQGGYGCVYYPGLFCDGKPLDNDKLVTKLQVDAEWTDREIHIGSIILKINNFNLHFAPVIESCDVNIKKLNEPDILDKCEIIKPEMQDYKIMFIPYIEKQGFLYTLFKDYNSKIILFLLEINKQLLSSIKKLIDSSLIHFDLKAENIILNRKNSYPIIIDFGISILKNNLSDKTYKTYFYSYHPEYTPWALEIHLICYFVKFNKLDSRVTEDDIIKVCSEFSYSNKRFKKVFSKQFIYNYKIKSIEFYSQFIGQDVRYLIKYLISISWYTWDSYSISILNLQIFDLIFNNKFFKNKLLNRFYEYTLLSLHYDPEKRPSVQQGIANIQSLYSKNDLEDNIKLFELMKLYINKIDIRDII